MICLKRVSIEKRFALPVIFDQTAQHKGAPEQHGTTQPKQIFDMGKLSTTIASFTSFIQLQMSPSCSSFSLLSIRWVTLGLVGLIVILEHGGHSSHVLVVASATNHDDRGIDNNRLSVLRGSMTFERRLEGATQHHMIVHSEINTEVKNEGARDEAVQQHPTDTSSSSNSNQNGHETDIVDVPIVIGGTTQKGEDPRTATGGIINTLMVILSVFAVMGNGLFLVYVFLLSK